VPRLLPLPIVLFLAACAPAASTQPERLFVLVDPGKYKTEAESTRALQIAQNDCKAKAMSTSATLEKTIASERNSIENLTRARDKATEMYATSYTLCMNNAGYIQK
jgi:hypothetical protein